VTLGCVVALLVLPPKMVSVPVLVIDALATLGTPIW